MALVMPSDMPSVGVGTIVAQGFIRAAMDPVISVLKAWCARYADGWNMEWAGRSALLFIRPPNASAFVGVPKIQIGRVDVAMCTSDRPNEDAVLVRLSTVAPPDDMATLRRMVHATLVPMLRDAERRAA